MKKILAGFCYRLLKGFELWAMIILMVLGSIYLNHASMDGTFVTLTRTGQTKQIDDLYINKDNLDQYNFAGSGLDAKDFYSFRQEPIPQESFDELIVRWDVIQSETRILDDALHMPFLIPEILILIFIPLFFGRLFSDGTVKNLISSGHSKRTIYLSSLFMSFILDILLFAINILIFAGFCLYYQWKPPVYYPMMIAVLVVKLLIFFTSSSAILAVLFISKKKTVAVITGFLLFFLLFFRIPNPAVSCLTTYIDYDSEDHYEEYMSIVKEKGHNAIEHRVDLSVYATRSYLEGKEVMAFHSILPDPVRYILLAMIYLDPAQINHNDNAISLYLFFRDGPMAINAVSNLCWIIVLTSAGIIIFNKREII